MSDGCSKFVDVISLITSIGEVRKVLIIYSIIYEVYVR